MLPLTMKIMAIMNRRRRLDIADQDDSQYSAPKQTATFGTRFEFRVIDNSGKNLDIWDYLPTDDQLANAYGPGRYRVQQINLRTHQLHDAQTIEIERDDYDSDPKQDVLEQLRGIAKLSKELSGESSMSGQMMSNMMEQCLPKDG